MTIISKVQELVFTNVGMVGIVEGDPDGIFSGALTGTGDASGGLHIVRFVLGTDVNPSKLDVIMKLQVVTAFNEGGALADVRVTMPAPSSLLLGSSSEEVFVLAEGVFGEDSALKRDFPLGYYTWPQKGQGLVYLELNAANGGASSTYQFSCQGLYWYAGPRRLAAMAA